MEKKHKSKIYTLEDVRNWRQLKKDELDLEKLKFHAEKDQLKSDFAKGFGKVMLYQGLLMAGEKILMTALKSFFKSDDKKKSEKKEKEGDS